MNCRFCGNALTHVFVDLGQCPPSNSYLTAAQLGEAEPTYPLKAFVCEKCFLVQIDEFKRAEDIFDNNYAYFSSYSSTWLAHARSYVEMAAKRFALGSDSQVIEVASNDGYLLQYFRDMGVPVLGIEPTESTAKVAQEKGIETRTDFFGSELARDLVKEDRQADLLLGNNVLAHVPDINDFVEGLRIALKPNGTVTMEFPHLLQLVDNTQFDTVYHEHFSYLSLSTTREIFAAHGLSIVDVDELTTHGGSLRVYARHAGEAHTVSQAVEKLLSRELDRGMRDLGFYLNFQAKVDKVRDQFVNFVQTATSQGKAIAAYGAAAKGNTLLNYCGIKRDTISFVADASPYKQGLYLPGSHIPIVDQSRIRNERPDFVIILPWNIKEEVAAQLDYIREWSGQFVTAIPRLEIW